jgi:hypothetical protein
MKSRKPFILLTLLALTVVSCNLTSPASDSPATAPATDVGSIPALPPALTADSLKTAYYKLGARDDHALVQLTDGKYQQGTDATTLDFAYVGLTDFIVLHDFTGDGLGDAAAIFYENYGGTGNFGFLTLFANKDNVPVFLSSLIIDDRPLINDFSVEGNEILLDATIHGFEDGGCCPTLRTNQWYRVVGTTLQLAKFVSFTPDGKPHDIAITSPTEGDSPNSIHLTGTVSIAPFENNLSYHVVDLFGAELAAGPVAVTAPDFGAPGTFDTTIDLSMIPAGSTVFLEIRDLSAADGSVIAMDSVKLNIK